MTGQTARHVAVQHGCLELTFCYQAQTIAMRPAYTWLFEVHVWRGLVRDQRRQHVMRGFTCEITHRGFVARQPCASVSSHISLRGRDDNRSPRCYPPRIRSFIIVTPCRGRVDNCTPLKTSSHLEAYADTAGYVPPRSAIPHRAASADASLSALSIATSFAGGRANIDDCDKTCVAVAEEADVGSRF